MFPASICPRASQKFHIIILLSGVGGLYSTKHVRACSHNPPQQTGNQLAIAAVHIQEQVVSRITSQWHPGESSEMLSLELCTTSGHCNEICKCAHVYVFIYSKMCISTCTYYIHMFFHPASDLERPGIACVFTKSCASCRCRARTTAISRPCSSSELSCSYPLMQAR